MHSIYMNTESKSPLAIPSRKKARQVLTFLDSHPGLCECMETIGLHGLLSSTRCSTSIVGADSRVIELLVIGCGFNGD